MPWHDTNEKETAEAIAKSKIQQGDSRLEREREAYTKWQNANRQLYEERKEYMRLKEQLGDKKFGADDVLM